MTATDVLNLKLPKEVMSLVQRGLAHAGVYDGTFGGVAGEQTKTALTRYFSGGNTGSAKLIDKICELARKEEQDKVREHGGANLGERVKEYQTADDLPDVRGVGYAWCASFQCWLIKKAIEAGCVVPFSRPTTALAYGFEPWAKGQPGVKAYKTGPVKRGDICWLDEVSHVFLAVGDEKDGMVPTIEGNTNKAGSREGDGVYAKSRARSGIRGFIRFEF